MSITRQQLGEWLDAYFAAWRSNEAAEVEALFTEEAIYDACPLAKALASARVIARPMRRAASKSADPMASGRTASIRS